MMSRMQAKRGGPSKGRGGSSGGGRGDGRITEAQHDEAIRILRAEYYQSVRAAAQDFGRAVKDGEITDQESMSEWVHQTVDGSYWVIYTHANFQVLLCSDNQDAYSEQFGEPPVEGNSIKWAALAFAAMEQDLLQQISAEGLEPDWNNMEEAPRRRPMPGRRSR